MREKICGVSNVVTDPSYEVSFLGFLSWRCTIICPTLKRSAPDKKPFVVFAFEAVAREYLSSIKREFLEGDSNMRLHLGITCKDGGTYNPYHVKIKYHFEVRRGGLGSAKTCKTSLLQGYAHM